MYPPCELQRNASCFKLHTSAPSRLFYLLLAVLISLTTRAQQPVWVVSSTGTGSAGIGYTNLGAAFTAINNGTIHSGAVRVQIRLNCTESAPAVLHGAAGFSSLVIEPVADQVTISGNFTTSGRSLIELNGADNVTINGDNPLTAGTARNLTLTFTSSQNTSQALVRLVTSSLPLDCNNISIQNCILRGNALNGNRSGLSSVTSASALSMGVVAAGGGSTTSATAAPTALSASGIAVMATIASTVNNLQIQNCSINQVGVGVYFNGTNNTSGNVLTITDNTIGSSVSGASFPGGPASTVYFKGIYFRGLKSAIIQRNTIQGICSWFSGSTTPNVTAAIECTTTYATGGDVFDCSDNVIDGVWSNNPATSATAEIVRAISMTGSMNNTRITCNRNQIRNIRSNTFAGTTLLAAVAIDLGCSTTGSGMVVSNNQLSDIYSTQAYGAAAVSLSTGGNNGHVYNNRITAVSAGAGGTTAQTIIAAIRIANGTGHKLYHNTIFLYNNFNSGTQISACIASLLTVANSNLDIRNNLLVNYSYTSSGSGSAHAALLLPPGLTSSYRCTINNNAYYGGVYLPTNYLAYLYNAGSYLAPSTGNSYQYVDFAAQAPLTASNLRQYTSSLNIGASNDNASFAYRLINPYPFTAATDLRIRNEFLVHTNGLKLESGAASGLTVDGSGLATDADGVLRAQVAAATRGGGSLPDIGATEIDAVPFVRTCNAVMNAGIVSMDGTGVYCGAASVPAGRTFRLTGYTEDITRMVIQWESSVTSGSEGFTAIVGANSAEYTTPAAPAQTTWYRAKLICTPGNTETYQQDLVFTRIITKPVASINPSTLPTAYCKVNPQTVTLQAVSATADRFEWNATGVTGIQTGISLTLPEAAYAQNEVLVSLRPYVESCAGDAVNVSFPVYGKPASYGLTGSTTVCSGSSNTLGLANSETGVRYSLLKNGLTTGVTVDRNSTGAFDFPVAQAAGTYTVEARYINESLNGPCAAAPMTCNLVVRPANRWLGGTGNWNMASKWSCGVPSATDVIVIDEGMPTLNVHLMVQNKLEISGTGSLRIAPGNRLTIASGGLADFGDRPVHFSSDATGTASFGKLDGQLINDAAVTVERYIPAHAKRAWRLLSVPTHGTGQTIRQAWQEGDANPQAQQNNNTYGTQITGVGSYAAATAAGFDNSSQSASMLSYDGSSWQPVSGTNVPIETNSGYFLFVRGNRGAGVTSNVVGNSTAATLRSTGHLYQGTLAPVTVAANQFGLIGNTYASAIDFTQINRSSSIGNVFYIWDAARQSGSALGAYQTFSATNGYECLLPGGSYPMGVPNTTIQSGQAFFVRSYGTSGTVTLDENAKSTESGSTGFRPADALNRIKFTLLRQDASGPVQADAAVVVFDDNYKLGIADEDAPKMENSGENLAIVTKGKRLSIEGRPFVTGKDTTQLAVSGLQFARYTLQIQTQLLDLEGLVARVHDRYTGNDFVIPGDGNWAIDFDVNRQDSLSYMLNRFMITWKQEPLPVQFVQAAAVESAGRVNLHWTTRREQQATRYVIEYSADGNRFDPVGTIPVTFNGSYSWEHTGSWNYRNYRIRAEHAEGQVVYSSLLQLATSARSTPQVYPNPVTGNQIQVLLPEQSGGTCRVSLLQLSGSVICQTQINLQPGQMQMTIPLSVRVPSGNYRLQLHMESGRSSAVIPVHIQ